MPTVLSTKILTTSQKELLLNAGVSFVEYDAISIQYLSFQIPSGDYNLIFTSQNAIKSYTKSEESYSCSKINALCVGKKSKSLLEKYGFKVIEKADNARRLAEIIGKKYNDQSFLYLSGNIRRDELPSYLDKKNVRYKEIMTYTTTLSIKAFDRQFDGVLFFSPSGVESFTSKNDLNGATAFCIGNTTAGEAKKYTDKIIISNKQTVENVIVQSIKTLRA